MSFNTKEIYNPPTDTFKNNANKGDVTLIIISKSSSEGDLDKTIAEFKKSGVDLKFTNVKRNSDDEIIKLSISASSKNSKAKFEADSNKPISPITIEYDSEEDSISIGSANANSFTFKSKDGKRHIRTSGQGSNIFVHSSHSDDDDSHEIIEDDDKIIIRSNTNTKIIKKDSENSFHILSDDDHVHQDIIEVNNDHTKGVNISFGKNKNPLILLDGEEISRKEMEALDTDTIKTVEVIKDDNNVEKYGKKAKHGVVIITSKDKK